MGRKPFRLCGESLEQRRLLAVDLSVEIESSSTEVRANSELSYVVRVRNNGTDDVEGATVDIDRSGLEQLAWNRRGPFSLPPTIDLAELDGRNGFLIALDGNFSDVITVGDVNGDGITEFALHQYDTDRTYVIFGNEALGFNGNLALDQLDGSNGFVVEGVETFESVGPAGDVNGDGFQDLLVGYHIVLGAADVGAGGVISTESDDHTVIFRVTSYSRCPECPEFPQDFPHAPAGDFNGDGFDDLIVGDPFLPRIPHVFNGELVRFLPSVGTAWILFGHANFGESELDLESLDPTKGFQLNVDTGELAQFGRTVESAGDMDNDGFDDVLISQWDTDENFGRSTRYLVYGGPDVGSSGELLLRTGNVQQHGVAKLLFYLFEARDETHRVDVNQDGLDDLVFAEEIFYGGTDRDFGNRPDRRGRIRAEDRFSDDHEKAPKAFGDFNGDQSLDMLFGSEFLGSWVFADEADQEGAIFLSLDRSIPEQLQLDAADGRDLVGIRGPGPVGDHPFEYVFAKRAVGDFNGDGIDDLAIAVDAVYVLFGSDDFRTYGRGKISQSLDIPAGGEVVFGLNGHVPFSAIGSLLLEASVTHEDEPAVTLLDNHATSAPISVTPPDIVDDTVDLQVSLDDGGNERLYPNEMITQRIVAANTGDTDAIGVHLSVDFHENLVDVTWSRSEVDFSGHGDIEQVIDLPAHSQIEFVVTALGGRGAGSFESIATVTPMNGQRDSNPTDNITVDHDDAPLRLPVPRVVSANTLCHDQFAVVGDYFLLPSKYSNDPDRPCEFVSAVNGAIPRPSKVSSSHNTSGDWLDQGDRRVLLNSRWQPDNAEFRQQLQRSWQTQFDDPQPFAFPAPSELNRHGDSTVSFEAGFFYRTHTESGEREIVARWKADPRSQPDRISVFGDRAVFVTELAETRFSNANRIYVMDLLPEKVGISVDAHLDNVTRSAPSDLISFTEDPGNDITLSESGYLTDIIEDVFPQVQATSPLSSLSSGGWAGNVDLKLGQSMTVGFPASIVNGAGADIRFRVDGNGSLEVFGLASDGNWHGLGIVSRSNREIDLGEHHSLSQLRLVASGLTPYTTIVTIDATIDATHVLTANAAENPDFEFAWDLNNDGIFGDRMGRSVGLNREGLLEFGLFEPGSYPIAVKVNDRLTDTIHTSTIEIAPPRGDVNLDGEVTFDDFVILSENFGSIDAERTEGDLDGDGKVSFADFLILSGSFPS